MRLFWVKMISGNHFPTNPHVWQQRKMKFSENSLPVDRNLRLWPRNDFTLSFSLQIISGSRKTQREREKEQHRESERKNAERARERTTQREQEPEHTLRPSQRVRERTKALIQPPRAPIQQTSERKNKSSDPATDIDLPHASHAELSQTITAPNAVDPRWVRAQTHTDPDQRTRSSSTSWSPVQPLRSPSQTQTHCEFSGTG